MRATVDLPEPDSPTMAVVVPRRSRNDTSSTAAKSTFCHGLAPRSWKIFVRFSTTMTSLRPSPNSDALCATSSAISAAVWTACSRTSARARTDDSRCDANDGALDTSRLV